MPISLLRFMFLNMEEKKQPILEQLCDKVLYYPRPRSFRYHLTRLPFIVNTRKNKALLQNLLTDNDPILFEGIHCTAWLKHPALKDRVKVVRTHNIEYQYYKTTSYSRRRYCLSFFLVNRIAKTKVF